MTIEGKTQVDLKTKAIVPLLKKGDHWERSSCLGVTLLRKPPWKSLRKGVGKEVPRNFEQQRDLEINELRQSYDRKITELYRELCMKNSQLSATTSQLRILQMGNQSPTQQFLPDACRKYHKSNANECDSPLYDSFAKLTDEDWLMSSENLESDAERSNLKKQLRSWVEKYKRLKSKCRDRLSSMSQELRGIRVELESTKVQLSLQESENFALKAENSQVSRIWFNYPFPVRMLVFWWFGWFRF
ncbi:unnamed protein product [Soboliphyme baturini]|uniref:HALZ domain-containing protein n=1 Tax=Soboliphyme baturini TaxID=241478 RepID=A0A183IN05_9BILA|nr:unnamed protein product [Soboliphyme baturini]